MSERPPILEREPTIGDIAQKNRDALERAKLDPDLVDMAEDLIITSEDEDILYRKGDGEPIDLDAAWENTVGWWMQLGLDPTDYFEEGFIEILRRPE